MKKLLLLLTFSTCLLTGWSQDIITKLNGDEIQAKILEITDTEVKYKKFSYLDGPTYTLKKTEIFMVKYPNGDKDLFGTANSTTVADTKPVVDTTRIFGIKIEKSKNPDYDVITFKNGDVMEGKVVDISETELTYTNKKGFVKLKS